MFTGFFLPASTPAEITRAARHMINTHGDHAAILARRRAYNLMVSGNQAAGTTWDQIAKEISRMQAATATLVQ
jgi:hypothetical protein